MFFILFLVSSSLLTLTDSKRTIAVSNSDRDYSYFYFYIYVKDIDWTYRTADVNLSIGIEAYPYNYSSVWVNCINEIQYVTDNESRTIQGGFLYSALPQTYNWSKDDTKYFYFRNRDIAAKFWLFGYPEFYPYDKYFLNLTFTYPDIDQLTRTNNTDVIVYCWIPNYDISYDEPKIIHDGPLAYLTESITIYRKEFLSKPFEMLVFCTFLVLGISSLISPKEIQTRLSIYLPIFILPLTLYTIILPTMPLRERGFSIMEIYILFTIIGAVSFIVASILEYKFYDEKRSWFENQFFEMISILFIAWSLWTVYDSYKKWSYIYPWITITDEPLYCITFAISIGFLVLLSRTAANLDNWSKFRKRVSKFAKTSKVLFKKLVQKSK